MSLEQSIAALTSQAGLLLDLPQNIQQVAVGKIGEITATYLARLATITANVYLDGANGLDTNPGTQALPFKTMQKAVDAIPIGGRGVIYLVAPYNMLEPVYVQHKYIAIASSTSVRHALSFNRRNIAVGATTYRELCGFRVSGNSSVNFNTLRINLPALDGTWVSFPPIWPELVSPSDTLGLGLFYVACSYIDWDIPAAPFGAILAAFAMSANFTSNVMVGASTTLNGKVLTGYSSTAGVATPNFFTTNLPTV